MTVGGRIASGTAIEDAEALPGERLNTQKYEVILKRALNVLAQISELSKDSDEVMQTRARNRASLGIPCRSQTGLGEKHAVA